MKKRIILSILAVFLAGASVLIGLDLMVTPSSAQQTETPKMPDVVTLAKDAKLGQVAFNHVKHNGGTYTITAGTPIACISCHHTARPAADIAKYPPLKTAWPADRTTTLTAELFTKDPKAAGVASCRDCHARTDMKPKLLDKIPEIKHEGSTAIMTMTNMQAFHRTCAGCHTEVKKTMPASKAPTQTQCTMCHKKTA